MKTIKIFLASSEELDYDRMAFGNLVRRLDDIYEKRGIRIKLFEWEDYDSAYNDKRKQDEYNEYVKQSDIFLALFHKKAGQFTIEEFDKASEQFKATASPKVYTYCKDLKPGEEESSELKEFKERLFNEMGHYWCRYDNRESLQFQFVMQLQLVESNHMDDVKVEDGIVTVNGLPVAKMENLKFAAANEDYLRMQSEIQELCKEIIGMQIELEEKQKALDAIKETPNNETLYKYIKNDVDNLIDKLQPKLNKYNKLKKDFARHQELLFNTAKRVSKLQGEHINDRIRRAIDALNNGLVREANTILNEAEEDAKNLLNEYKQSKEITEQKRQNLVISIEELSLKATSIMADASIPIDERIKQAEEIYELADTIAQEINYEQKKYINFLWEYSGFLGNYARYDKALEVYNRLIKLGEEFYGMEHPDTAASYNNIGIVYSNLGDYDKALEYYKHAIKINEKALGKENPSTALSYNSIGIVYAILGNFGNALEYFQQALEIQEKVLGKEHPDTASSYNNIGNVYADRGDYDKALEYYKLALDIREKVLGKEHPDTAGSYNNIGLIYKNRGEYDKALEYYKHAIKINEKVLGKEHPETATSYDNIGNVYTNCGDYDKALEYKKMSLDIREKILGKEHPNTAASYNNIGNVYKNLGDYDKALEYYKQALDFQEKVLGKEHPNTAALYNNIGNVYKNLGDYEKAFEYFKLAADRGVTDAMNQVGVYFAKGQGTSQSREESIKWYKKAAIKGDALGQYNLGRCYDDANGLETNKEQAFKWYTKSAIQGCAEAQCALAIMYNNGIAVDKNATIAVEWFMKAAEQGNDVAQYNLAVNYENGKGITPDKKKAMEWYLKSADQGNKKAQCAIGLMYVNGEIVEQDYDKATEWFVLSANQNYDTAQYMLGAMYECYNSQHNIKEAIKQYTNAASQNNVHAQHRLGMLYSMGGEVIVDLEQSVMWLEKSANQNNTESYNQLAWNLHLQGRYQEALPWAEKAVKTFPQNPGIIDTLASVYQDLGRYEEALEQFKLCLKLQMEQGASENSIHATEEKIAALKAIIENQ